MIQIWIFYCFEGKEAAQSLDHLSEGDKETYETNLGLLQGLQIDLQTKKEKYKNNPKLYERFIPGIELSIQEFETAIKALLESKVFSFSKSSKCYKLQFS